MNKTLGIIACNYRLDGLREMTLSRPPAAMPFGGRYAMSDFPLSAMVHAGIKSVGFVNPYLYRPIVDHLGSGKEWDLDRKSGGLFFLPGVTNWLYSKDRFALKDLKKNMDFFQREEAESILLSGSNSIFSLDLREHLEAHHREGRTCTFLYHKAKEGDILDPDGSLLDLDGNGLVKGLIPAGMPEEGAPYFMDLLIVSRGLLLSILQEYEEGTESDPGDLARELAGRGIAKGVESPGYYATIYSKESYFKANMDLMKPQVSQELFHLKRRVITRVKDNPPTRYGDGCDVREAIVSSGCTLDGKVVRSLLCRGVVVEEGAKVKDSIIMHDCVISKGAYLENVILDKSVRVTENSMIKGDQEVPLFIPKSKRI